MLFQAIDYAYMLNFIPIRSVVSASLTNKYTYVTNFRIYNISR